MQDSIEFNLNGTEYSAGLIPHGTYEGMYCWSTSKEEGEPKLTLEAAQQDAIDWESGRKDRYEGSEEQDRDAYWEAVNRRMDDRKEAAHES